MYPVHNNKHSSDLIYNTVETKKSVLHMYHNITLKYHIFSKIKINDK